MARHQSENIDHYQGASAYCKAMSKLGAWLGNLELAVFVAHYKIPLMVYQRQGSPQIWQVSKKGAAPIRL
eukprot:3561009-Pyramimonas_sp.AAC.1